MKKKIVLLSFLSLFLFAAYFGLKYFGIINKPTNITLPGNNSRIVNYKVVEVARDLYVPWSLAFPYENRILVAEREGTIRQIVKGVLMPDPIFTINDVATSDEEGLMGMVLDPNYSVNKFVYIDYTYMLDGIMFDRVVRLVDNGDDLMQDKVLIERIPAAKFHAGGRLKFGPDGLLYITTGDALKKDLAQNTGYLGGKILRINRDGTIPEDNPFSGSPIYSLGHRNPQGLAWNSKGQLYSIEHGPSVIDGPAGGDEINLVIKGQNYGWPLVSHEKSKEGPVPPLEVYTPAVAPASAMIYSGTLFPQFKGNLFFGGLKGEGLYRVELNVNDSKQVIKTEKMSDINLGRIREVIEAPSGEIYFTTSNEDGRGKPNDGDDKVFKLTPL